MIDKSRIIRLLDSAIDRSDRWIEDAEKREDYTDVFHYEGEKKMAEELKTIISRW
jgi:hypothetical protein